MAASTQPPTSAVPKETRTSKGTIIKKAEKARKKKVVEREDKEVEKPKAEEEEGEGGESQPVKQRKSSGEKFEKVKSSEAVTPSTPDDQLLPLLGATSEDKEEEVLEDLRKAEDSLAVINRHAEHEEQKVTTVA